LASPAKPIAAGSKSVAMSNQSRVYAAFSDHEKLTIPEVAQRVNAIVDGQEVKALSEQTVRRSIQSLVKIGSLQKYGTKENAVLYGKVGMTSGSEDEIISLAGNLLTVADFLRIIVDEEANPFPFVVKVQPENYPISQEFQRKLRKRMASVVLTAVSPGFNDSLGAPASFLHKHIEELEHMIKVMRSFLDSPVWFAQYRDKIAAQIRQLQKDDIELFKLGVDYIKDK
jgi:hypothetical protein